MGLCRATHVADRDVIRANASVPAGTVCLAMRWAARDSYPIRSVHDNYENPSDVWRSRLTVRHHCAARAAHEFMLNASEFYISHERPRKVS
jgi:hypothetical protein